MTTTAFSIDSRFSIEPHEQIQSLLDYISGDLDKDSLILLEGIYHKAPDALDKLVTKLKKNSITIKACDFNLVTKALTMQANLSEEILPTIHAHLLDNKVNSLASILNLLTNNLQNELPASDTLQAAIHIINNLQIFAEPIPEEQFIKSIMLLMLNFKIKQNDSTSGNYQESAKWIKSLLAISEKSSLIHLVDYIAIRLHIAAITIHGAQKNIELTELFSTIEDIAISVDISTCKANNQELITNISACTLIGIICKRDPHAMVDVVDMEMIETDTNITHNLENYYPTSSEFQGFLNSDNFIQYYKEHTGLADYNGYTYLSQLTNLLHAQLTSGVQIANQKLKNYIVNCVNSLDVIAETELESYLANLETPDEIVNIFCNEFLGSIHQPKTTQVNTLDFCANKLVSLGFAPRSSVFTEVGSFQPLVCKNKAILDRQNNIALNKYIARVNPEQRVSLVKELIVALLIRYRIKPHVLENQPKPIHRRAIDSTYPVPTTHKHTKSRETSAKRFSNGQSNYPLTFFAKKYASQSPKPQFNPEAESQQYGG